MNIGDKAITNTGESVEILSEEITTQDIAVNSSGNLFVDDNGDLGTETIIVRKVRFLDGPKKGKELPLRASEISPAS